MESLPVEKILLVPDDLRFWRKFPVGIIKESVGAEPPPLVRGGSATRGDFFMEIS
mgnify:CR=1 FL=1